MTIQNNPFSPGSGLNPPYLAGRDAELNAFSRMILHINSGKPANMLVHGMRGVGKTVLLKKFEETCISEKFLTLSRLQYSQKYSNPEIFLKSLQHDLDRITKAASKTIDAKRKIASVGKYLKPRNIEIPGLLSYQPSYDTQTDAPMENRIYDYLSNAWKILEGSGHQGIVFLLDEFHEVTDVKEKQWYTLTDFIGAVNMLQADGYRYALVLSGLPTLIHNVKYARSYSERMFTPIHISNLSEDAATKAITEPLKESSLDFADDLVSALLHDTGRYPYFIQFFCSEILDSIKNKQRITLADYNTIRRSIIKKLERGFFAQRLESLSNAQKSILDVMASLGHDDMEFSSIYKAAKMGKGSVFNHLKRLEEKGIIYKPQRGMYQFSLPMFRGYLLGIRHSGA